MSTISGVNWLIRPSGWASNGLLNNLVAYYKLDSGATDAHNSNDWTPSNISWNTSNYLLGSAAADFNGSTSKIDLPNLTVNDNLTINVWFHFTTTSATAGFLYASRTSNAVADRMYIYQQNGNIYFAWWGSGFTANSWYNNGARHMATMTKNSTTYKYYLDAVYKGTFTDANVINTLVTPAWWYLRYASVQYYNWWADEWAIWSAALTDGWVSVGNTATGQIWDLYNSWAWLPYSSFTS